MIKIYDLAANILKEVEGANLWRANLMEANLMGANLGGVYLERANLMEANLMEANLGGANLGGANLWGAYLGGANLMGANLGGANLGGANLWGAYLGGANLMGANLMGARYGRGDTVFELEAVPIQISGLKYHVMIFSAEGYIQAGCFLKSVEDWKAMESFTEDEEFFKKYKNWILDFAKKQK